MNVSCIVLAIYYIINTQSYAQCIDILGESFMEF